MSFIPDWEISASPEEAEKQLSFFKFNGEGWYLGYTYSVYVCKLEDGLYRFSVWNRADMNVVFRSMGDARIRLRQ